MCSSAVVPMCLEHGRLPNQSFCEWQGADAVGLVMRVICVGAMTVDARVFKKSDSCACGAVALC